jgi:acyl transferase domain-containing protein/acyl carrier protein
MDIDQLLDTLNGNEIAIIGLAGRFPGARNIDEFWLNLRDGVESVCSFSDEELEAAGVSPDLICDPRYVRARSPLDGIELFDANFFEYSPREAEIIDPQQRLFLECAWQALESAGYNAKTFKGPIGVYAGSSTNTYFLLNIYSNKQIVNDIGFFELHQANDTTYLATRTSYKLDLHGPSLTVQTACSMSLVAVHLACQSLLSGESDMALAGGVSAMVPQRAGHLYQEGGIMSPDGHCRAFDERAQGTTSGSGLGVVVLKRLPDALADGDTIHAVIKGSAINNDGASKVGFTAPSVSGQAQVIAQALAMAGIAPDTITYVETHGTGTPLGDPVEIAALTQAFRAGASKNGFCALGSVKTNIGHLDAAAGVAGLIKTVLALKHRLLPPSLHFVRPNPHIDFANSPFYVNTSLAAWQPQGCPRRAGVSAFGFGGTNAHVILEEAPVVQELRQDVARPEHLLVLSAKTDAALKIATGNLVEHLKQHPEQALADVAYALQVGRQTFRYCQIVTCCDREDAIKALETVDSSRIFRAYREDVCRPIVFMFPGQGTQYVNMALELYRCEQEFRQQIDLCSEILRPHLGLDLRRILYPEEKEVETAGKQLEQTRLAQPALFVIELALARLWMSWGIQPQAMIGHSIGEYVAAHLAGVISLEDALFLVAARGRLMQQMPGGAMLAVPLSEQEVLPRLNGGPSLAAVNSSRQCIISGQEEEVDAFAQQLLSENIVSRRLPISYAFHSKMMEPVLEVFAEEIKRVKLHSPQIPYLSNVTGTWITASEATDPDYWVMHLRQTVRFADGIREATRETDTLLLEVGPGSTLCKLVRQHATKNASNLAFSSLPASSDGQSALAFLLTTLGRLWLAGVDIQWDKLYTHERRHRIPLPTYPFERQRYWVEPARDVSMSLPAVVQTKKKPDITSWLYTACWKQSAPLASISEQDLSKQRSCWLVFKDTLGIGDYITRYLAQVNQQVITVAAGDCFARSGDGFYTIRPGALDDYHALLQELASQGSFPQEIVHLWLVTDAKQMSEGDLEQVQVSGFFSLLFLTQSLQRLEWSEPLCLRVISNDMQDVGGNTVICPEKATTLGLCKVISQEYPAITCSSIDVSLPPEHGWQERRLLDQLTRELAVKLSEHAVAYRADRRWVQTFEPVQLDKQIERSPSLRERGVYLLIGGLGGIGMALAEYLAKHMRARLILAGRSQFPERGTWDQWLRTHDDQDPISQKIRKVQMFEEWGAEVLICRADITDLERMQHVLTLVDQHFGTLHGVIHTAGFTGDEAVRTINEIEAAECKQHFLPKLQGLYVLEKVLRDRTLDFCLLQSSLSTVLGGIGLAAYAAANCLLDAFAHNQNLVQPVPWISANWDSWKFEEKSNVQEAKRGLGKGIAELALTKEEGQEVFAHILSLVPLSRVVISTGDLPSRMEQWTKLRNGNGEMTSHNASSNLYSRPGLQNAYVAPRNAIEQTIASIWQELLGIEQVGIYDNFFELGGHSLLATRVVARIREALRLELPLRSFFASQCVAELAQAAEEMFIKKLEALPEDAHKILPEFDHVQDIQF